MKEFPSVGNVSWDLNKTIVAQINEYIEQMGDNFDAQMTSYFEDFKKSMKQRMRIVVSLVEHHVNEICFLVDIDYTYIQVVVPWVRWIRPLGYELDVDQALAAITTLLIEEIEKAAKPFGTYDIVKSRVVTDMKIASTVKRKDKLIKKIKKKFGADIEAVGTVEEEEEEESEQEGDEPRWCRSKEVPTNIWW